MLFGTVLLWALNSTVTRYVLTHGFHPLAYATIRYAAATALFWAFTWLLSAIFVLLVKASSRERLLPTRLPVQLSPALWRSVR